MRVLKANLELIADNGIARWDVEEIRQLINRLIVDTLADANAVFCTNNAASKVNLYTNFRPKLLVCNKACCATELFILLAFVFYKLEA